MLRLKLMTATLAALMVVPGVWVATVGQTPAKKDPVAEKAKELPKEVKIPEARTDKVLLFQEQDAKVSLEQQLLVEKFKASPEWRALEDRKNAVAEKMAAELSSALRLAGVEEKDFPRYRYDMKTLKLTFNMDEKTYPEVNSTAKPNK